MRKTVILALMIALCLPSLDFAGEDAPTGASVVLQGAELHQSPEVTLRWAPVGEKMALAGFVTRERNYYASSRSGLLTFDLLAGSVEFLTHEAALDFAWTGDASEVVQFLRLGPPGGGRYCRISSETGQISPVLTLPLEPDIYALSRDGRRVAYAVDGGLFVADLAGAGVTPRRIVPTGQEDICPSVIFWLGNNRLLVGDAELRVLDVAANSTVAISPPDGDKWTCSRGFMRHYIATDDDGKHIAIVTRDASDLYVLSETDSSWTLCKIATAVSTEMISLPHFSRDGSKIAFVRSGPHGTGKHSLWVASSSAKWTAKLADDYQTGCPERGFDWSPNGRRIAYVAEDNSIKLVPVER